MKLTHKFAEMTPEKRPHYLVGPLWFSAILKISRLRRISTFSLAPIK